MPEIEDLSGRKLGEFVLRARIGSGAFGAVYRCEQPLLGRQAVIKVLHPRLRHNSVVRQRFLREAQLASQLDHPCAAHIYAFGIESNDGLFWIAMEMVQGVGLNRWLRAHGAMPIERFVPLFEQLAEVVHAAHERGIVHRDLKPSNVMVIERAGRLVPKLLDFGVAMLVDGAPTPLVAPELDLPGDAGDGDASALAAGSDGTAGLPETVTQTASTPRSGGSDRRRLTRMDSTVGSPPYMSPEQWTHPSEVGPSSDLYALGVLAYEAINGRRPFNATDLSQYADLHCDAPVPPVRDGLPPGLDRLFERALAKRPEQRWQTAPELAAALRAEWIAARVGPGAPGRDAGDAAGDEGEGEVAPYLGLAPYAAGDAERFVGREAEVAAFRDRLRARPLHVVVGPPGTGKSSFVHAGVLARLPPGWRVVALRPGAAPLAALAFRLEAAGVAGDGLRAQLASSPGDAAARVAEAAGAGAIVVVIDQLEELFTLGVSGEERAQFAAAVARFAASADLPIRVIATIRDDFLMQLDALPALRPLLSPALVLLGNPLHDDLVRVVVEPARRAGYTLSDPELAHDMVRAVASRPGALALLSFTALRLWELRDRALRQLTRRAYDAMDGIAGALVRHAEATFEALSADEQRVAREMFRQLVTADGARVPLSAEELHQRLAAPGSAGVLDRLIAARLLATSEAEPDAAGARRTQVEVIHDALLEAWPRLRRWIREDLDGVRMREQLRIAARQWSDRGRPRGLLWRDGVLVDLQRWLRQPRATQLSELEAAFVEASLGIARRTRLRRAIGLVAAGAAAVLAVFLYSWMRGALARRAVEQQLVQAYVDRGQSALLDGKRAEALVYLAQAVRRGDDSLAVRFMFERAAEPVRSAIGRLPASSGRTWSVAFSPDGRRIVTSDDVGARIWDARSRELLCSLPHGDIVYQAVFTPDGSQVLTAGGGSAVKLWDAATGELVRSLTRARTEETPLAYKEVVVLPGGAIAAAIDDLGQFVDVWELATGRVVAEMVDDDRSPTRVGALALSGDARWLATTSGNDVHVYDTASWKLAAVISEPLVNALSFDPTGPRLATATRRGDVSVWAIPAGRIVRRLHAVGGEIDGVAWSRDGTSVIAAGQMAVPVWNADTGDLEIQYQNHPGRVTSVEFDPSSRLALSVGSDGSVAVMDLALQTVVSILAGPRTLRGAAHFDPSSDPSSQRVAAASWDGAAWLWSARPQHLQWGTPAIGDDCGQADRIDVDHRMLVISCRGHGVRVWDTAERRLVAELSTAETQLPGARAPSEAIVSSGGDRLAVSRGRAVLVYELPGGKPIRTIDHASAVNAIAFSPTGHDVLSADHEGGLWITRDGADPQLLARLGAASVGATWLPDGRVVASDAASRLHVVDVRSRATVAELALPRPYLMLRSSSDGGRLLAFPASGASELALLDLTRYRLIAQLPHEGRLFSARFLERDRVVTTGSDGSARIWNAGTGELQKTYNDRSTFLMDAAVDPAGTVLVTAGGDGKLRFWDLASGRLMWTLPAHRSPVNAVRFDGNDLLTRGFDGDLARWTIPPVPPPPEFLRGIDRVLRCLPVRFDDRSGDLIDQVPRCEFP